MKRAEPGYYNIFGASSEPLSRNELTANMMRPQMFFFYSGSIYFLNVQARGFGSEQEGTLKSFQKMRLEQVKSVSVEGNLTRAKRISGRVFRIGFFEHLVSFRMEFTA